MKSIRKRNTKDLERKEGIPPEVRRGTVQLGAQGELLRYSTANLYYFYISRACSRVKDKIDRRLAHLKGKN